jgi:hypothetical protein
VRVARDWLLECFTDEGCAESIGLLNAVGVVQGIESHWAGGWPQFLADNLLAAPPAPVNVAQSRAEFCESQVPLAETQDLREEWLRAASFWWGRA